MPTPTPSLKIRSAETPKDLSLWHGKREVIKNLFVHQKRTLDDVKKTMEREYGFPTTLKLSEYEQVVRDVFKYRKNLSADEWNQSIGPEIARRKAAGKRSAVFLNDSEVEHVDRKIQRSLKSKRLRRSTKANLAAWPYGVVIKTPSPQPSAFASSLPFDKDPSTCDLEQNTWVLSSMEFLEDYATEIPWVSSLMDIPPLPGARPDVEVLSVQLLRQNSPIHEFLIQLNEYQRKFNHADLRLFGPNATVGILGKICFDFSNNLQGRTIPEIEMTSILDWIGYSADIASLKTFFGQKGLTVLAAWEGLNSTIRQRRHLAAFKTIFSVHLSLGDQVPCTIGPSSRDIGHYLMESPEIALILINAYPCYTGHLDLSLQIAATTPGHPITSKLVQQLSGAGASFKNEHRPFIVDDFISRMGRRKCQTADLDLLKIFLEAGVVVDWQPELQRDWPGPNEPIHATDYLLLEGGYDTHNRGLWSLVSSYSDRQQTTVTVPGIFEAAQGGHDQLRFYLNDRTKPCGDHDRKQILEIALSEASERGYVKVLHNLMQFGVDPNVRMLPEFYRDISCTYKMTNTNEWYTYKKRNIWHPVVRAANAGKVDTLRMLVAVSSIDIALVNERVGAFMQLDLYALRDMENSQLDQILRLLLTLGLTTATRNDILLQALGPCRCHSHEHGADFEFVDQLLELGLASSDHRVHLDGEMHLLVCAIRRNCAIRSLNYLVERDMLVLSALSASTIEALCDAALRRPDSYSIMEFLSQKLEGFKAYVQKNSSLLLKSLQDNFCCEFHVNSGKDRDDNCSVMITAKWLLGLGATLDISGFSQLTQHASENFILAMIDSVPNIKELEKWSALRQATEDGRYNLAVALVERGAMQLEINDPQELHSETALQVACHKGAPLWFIKFLVDKGADVNAPPTADSGTALQNACGARASLSCVRFLLDQGADVNAPTAPDCEFYRGLTAIHLAVNNTSMNMVGLLLDHGADVNALSRFLRVGLNLRGIRAPLNFLRPIDLAAWRSHLDMVHFLIEAGGRSSYPGLTGFDGAIALATEYRHFAIAALLQKHADSHRGDRMEAERRWLQANANVRMYEGRIELQADDPLMEIDETESEDSEADSEAAAVDGL